MQVNLGELAKAEKDVFASLADDGHQVSPLQWPAEKTERLIREVDQRILPALGVDPAAGLDLPEPSGEPTESQASPENFILLRRRAWLCLRRGLIERQPNELRQFEFWLRSSDEMLLQMQQASHGAQRAAHGTQPVSDKMLQFRAALIAHSPHVWVTPALIGINVVIYLLMCLSAKQFFSFDADLVLRWGANYGPKTLDGEWWRLLTSMFLHFGLIHIGLNMWVLHGVGGLLERLLGNVGYLITYLLAGLCGSIASVVWNGAVIAAGASGAVFGVCGGLFGFLALRRDSVPTEMFASLRYSFFAFLIYNTLFAFIVPGIDQAAHLGGLVGGILCGLVLSQTLDAAKPPRRWPRNLALLAGGSLLVGGAIWLMPEPPADWRQLLSELDQSREKSLSAFFEAQELYQGEQIDDAEYARRLSEQVLPPWQQALQQLEKASEDVPRQLRPNVERVEKAMQLRSRSWQELIKALQTNDPESAKAWKNLWDKAEATLQER